MEVMEGDMFVILSGINARDVFEEGLTGTEEPSGPERGGENTEGKRGPPIP